MKALYIIIFLFCSAVCTGSGELASMQMKGSLSVLATAGLVIMWGVSWYTVAHSREKIMDILLSATFFKTVAVMGVIAGTVVLSLVGRLDGNITGAILFLAELWATF